MSADILTLRAGKTDWPAVPEPKQLPSSEYVTITPKLQGFAESFYGEASRVKAILGGNFATRASLERLQRHLAEASTLVEAMAKEAP